MGEYTLQVRNTDSWEGWNWGAKHAWGHSPVGQVSLSPNIMLDVSQNTDMILYWGCDSETTPGARTDKPRPACCISGTTWVLTACTFALTSTMEPPFMRTSGFPFFREPTQRSNLRSHTCGSPRTPTRTSTLRPTPWASTVSPSMFWAMWTGSPRHLLGRRRRPEHRSGPSKLWPGSGPRRLPRLPTGTAVPAFGVPIRLKTPVSRWFSSRCGRWGNPVCIRSR